MGDDNVKELPVKQPKNFKDLVSSADNELNEAKVKAARSQVKEIRQKKAEAEKLIRGYDEELNQLEAKFNKGLL